MATTPDSLMGSMHVRPLAARIERPMMALLVFVVEAAVQELFTCCT
jgi:hypothetical protein